MKIEVELYGNLRKLYSGEQYSHGVEIDIPDGAKVTDLLNQMNIPDQLGVVVTMEGRILRPDDEIRNGKSVRVFQAVHGG